MYECSVTPLSSVLGVGFVETPVPHQNIYIYEDVFFFMFFKSNFHVFQNRKHFISEILREIFPS